MNDQELKECMVEQACIIVELARRTGKTTVSILMWLDIELMNMTDNKEDEYRARVQHILEGI